MWMENEAAIVRTETFSAETAGETIAIPVVTADDTSAVALPADMTISESRLLQHGDNLVITAPNGNNYQVTDYFLLLPPPTLVTETGVTINPALIDAITRSSAARQYAQADGADGPAIVGQVGNLSGEVFIVRPDGTRAQLSPGDTVFEGDIVETGANGTAIVILADNATIALADGTRLSLNSYVMDPATGAGDATFAILSGSFTVTGSDTAAGRITVNTPGATITLSSGSVAGQANAAGEDSWLTVLNGEAEVNTQAGTVTLTGPGETTVVTGFDAVPTEPFTLRGGELTAVYGEIAAAWDQGGDELNDIATAAGSNDEPTDAPVPDSETPSVAAAEPPPEFDPGSGFTPPQIVILPTDEPSAVIDSTNDTPAPEVAQPIATPLTGDVSLTGTDGAEALIGGAGNDTLDGLGGSDVLLGGSGEDRLIFDSADATIDGGAGNDTLVVSGDGLLLNAATFATASSVETIDLLGSGNVIFLSGAMVESLSDTGTLTVHGGAGNNLAASSTDDAWHLLGTLDNDAGAFRVFENETGSATLLVDREMGITDLTELEIPVSRIDAFPSGGISIIGENNSGHAGFSVSSAGDVNGDGIDDLIVGAKDTRTGGVESGAGYVVFGSASGV